MERIKYEVFITKEVLKTVGRACKCAKSLSPLTMLLPLGKFKIGEDGPEIKGSLFKYYKHIYGY